PCREPLSSRDRRRSWLPHHKLTSGASPCASACGRTIRALTSASSTSCPQAGTLPSLRQGSDGLPGQQAAFSGCWAEGGRYDRKRLWRSSTRILTTSISCRGREPRYNIVSYRRSSRRPPSTSPLPPP